MGGVRLVAALVVPLLKGTLLKEGSAEEELAAFSTTDDDLVKEGAVERGFGSSTTDDSASGTAELGGASSAEEGCAGGAIAVYGHVALALIWRMKKFLKLTTVIVTGGLVTVTVTGVGHDDSSGTTTRLSPPFSASPPLGVSP